MPLHDTCSLFHLSTNDTCTALLGLSTSSFLCPQTVGKCHYSHVITRKMVCNQSCIKVIFRTPTQLPPNPSSTQVSVLFFPPSTSSMLKETFVLTRLITAASTSILISNESESNEQNGCGRSISRLSALPHPGNCFNHLTETSCFLLLCFLGTLSLDFSWHSRRVSREGSDITFYWPVA